MNLVKFLAYIIKVSRMLSNNTGPPLHYYGLSDRNVNPTIRAAATANPGT